MPVRQQYVEWLQDEQYHFLTQTGCDWLAGDVVLDQIDSLPRQMEALGMFVFSG